MNGHIISSPHKHDGSSVTSIMREVCVALIPGILIYAWLISWGVLIQCILAIGFAVCAEALMLRLRRLPVKLFLSDYSCILTALLFALSISPYTPWWVNMCGMFFAIMLIKHAFGGIGNNLFNPAMAGFVFVLLSFPAEMTHWPAARSLQAAPVGLTDCLHIIFTGRESITAIDAVTAATPLSYMQTQINGMNMISEFSDELVFGSMAGTGWEWVALIFLLSGGWLAFRKIIYWQIPAALIGTVFLISLVFYWFDADVYASPMFHVFTVSTLLGAFFVATDPVSSATTPRGRWIFAAGIGLLTYLIRTWGAYPDGLAFAVLLMNCAVPLLDHYTRPKVLGETVAD